jgi:hypothetical protein
MQEKLEKYKCLWVTLSKRKKQYTTTEPFMTLQSKQAKTNKITLSIFEFWRTHRCHAMVIKAQEGRL